MMIQNLTRRSGLGALVLLLGLGSGLGADAPPQTIDAGGLTFQAPASWKSSKPTSTMRRAQLKVDPVAGDTDPAELVVFAFPGGAGGVQANLQRWQEQFRDKDGKPPRIESKTVQGKNTDVIRVEIAGRYVAPKFPGSAETYDKPDYHLLGAIVTTEDTGYFLKMVGPDKTMIAARPAFDELLASIKVGK
jgi:hypothetical protein